MNEDEEVGEVEMSPRSSRESIQSMKVEYYEALDDYLPPANQNFEMSNEVQPRPGLRSNDSDLELCSDSEEIDQQDLKE